MRLKEIYNTKGHEGVREHFKTERYVKIEYVRKNGEILVFINGEDVELPFYFFESVLPKWLTPENRVHISTKEEILEIFPLKDLVVDSINFSQVTLETKESGVKPLLVRCKVNSVLLPSYPETVVELKGLLENAKIANPLYLGEALKNTKLKKVHSILPNVSVPMISLLDADFSNVTEMSDMFFSMGVEKIVLPENIAANVDFIRANWAFCANGLKEIENIEHFPFDKLVSAEGMFRGINGGELVINSKLEKLNIAARMFDYAKNTTISLPKLERIPLGANWFYALEDCTVFLPKLEKVSNKEKHRMQQLDDSNELIVNEKLAKQLR